MEPLSIMTPNNVRLNYTISSSINDQLADYCELTGRTASDLVRQLVCEVLEEDRQLPPPHILVAFVRESERHERRTDMWMSATSLAAFDEKLEEEGYPSKSAVIAFMLSDFLQARANHAGEEMVRVTTLIDRITYTKLALAASNRHQQVEEFISSVCKDYTNQLSRPTT
jgi:hypothetical protein